MKFKKLLTAVAIAALALFYSCREEEVVGNVLRSQKITAELADPYGTEQSRSCVDVKNPSTTFIGLLWQADDKIGVFSKDASTGNYAFTNAATETVRKAEFEGEMSGTPYYAYFPYSEENSSEPITALKGTVLAEQKFNPTDGTLACDYKYGMRTDEEGVNKFTFKQLFTMLRVTIDATDTDLEGENLESITLKVTDAEGNARNICGDFTFDATNGEWTAGSNLSNSVSMPWSNRPTLSTDKTYQGFITLFPVVQTGDQLSVEVITNAHKATFTANCQVAFESGYVYTIPLKLKAFAENEKFDWNVEEFVLPTITSFGFEVADNTGKLLDNQLVWSNNEPSFTSVSSLSATIDDTNKEITLTIPYLYDFKLIPTFAVSSTGDCTVSVNGVTQESGTTEVDFTQPVTYSLSNSKGGTSTYSVKIVNTGLPVVVINQSTTGDFDAVTETKQIGFLKWEKRTLNEFVDFMIRAKDTKWVEDDVITVYNSDGSVDCSVNCGVRLRGNTTKEYPKKPFAIKLTEKTSVLGMPKHKRWVLLANWLDHSMIRNTVGFDVAHAIEYAWRQNSSTIEPGIPWCPSGQNVELVFVENGTAHHVGNYFLGEQIKIDENRLNIKDPLDIDEEPSASDYTQYGYLIEGVTSEKRDETSYFTTDNGIIFQFKDELNSTILAQIKEKMNRIEGNIVDGSYSTAYEELDIHSLIDQMLVWELTLNREYGDPSSVYMYLDGDGKLSAGPVWDFDRGTFQNQENADDMGNSDRVKPDNEWMYWRKSSSESYIWYSQLAADETFQKTVQERWAVIKPYLELVPSMIQAYGEKLKVSYEYNNAMWPTTKADINRWKYGFTDWSGDELIESYEDVISNFITVYNERLAGMNTLITNGTFTNE